MPNEQERRDSGINWEEIGYMDDRGVTNTTEEAIAWDRANPNTCRHHVVVRAAGYPVDGLSLWGCVSCEKLVPSDIADKRNYEFDVVYDVYVHSPVRTTSNKQVIEELNRVFPDGYELYTRKDG